MLGTFEEEVEKRNIIKPTDNKEMALKIYDILIENEDKYDEITVVSKLNNYVYEKYLNILAYTSGWGMEEWLKLDIENYAKIYRNAMEMKAYEWNTKIEWCVKNNVIPDPRYIEDIQFGYMIITKEDIPYNGINDDFMPLYNYEKYVQPNNLINTCGQYPFAVKFEDCIEYCHENNIKPIIYRVEILNTVKILWNKSWCMSDYFRITRKIDVETYKEPNISFGDIDLTFINPPEIEQIREGLRQGLDVSYYASDRLSRYCMGEIRRGLELNLDVSSYANPLFSSPKMEVIRKGIMKGLDVTLFAKEEYKLDLVKEISYSLNNDIDIMKYLETVKDPSELLKIVWKINAGLDPNKSLEEQIEYGYKAFNKDMTCRHYHYKEGETYKKIHKPKCCVNGFHFCLNMEDCFNYYNWADCVVHKVRILGDIDTMYEHNTTKLCTNEIKILERVYES